LKEKGKEHGEKVKFYCRQSPSHFQSFFNVRV